MLGKVDQERLARFITMNHVRHLVIDLFLGLGDLTGGIHRWRGRNSLLSQIYGNSYG